MKFIADAGFTPVRKLLDAGAPLVFAFDWNPGSAPMGKLLMQASVPGVYEKLTVPGTLAAMTRLNACDSSTTGFSISRRIAIPFSARSENVFQCLSHPGLCAETLPPLYPAMLPGLRDRRQQSHKLMPGILKRSII